MKWPHENWIKYLLLCPGVKKGEIPGIVQMYNLWVPSNEELTEVQTTLNKTKPKPFRLTSLKVKNWLRRQRIYSLIFDKPAAVMARSYLGNHRIRKVLEALILANTPRNKIPEYCQSITGHKPTLTAVKMFEHFFWKRDAVPAHVWQDLLGDYPNGKELLKGYDRGPEFALWRLGYRELMGKNVILKGVLHEAVMRYFETGDAPNDRATALTAKMWAETIFKAIDEMNEAGDGIQQVLSQLKSISIKLEKTDIKDIEALTQGHHSLSQKKQDGK